MTAIKTLIFTLIIVLGVVTVGGPYLILRIKPVAALHFGDFKFAGLALIALGAIIYAWCAWDFGRSGKGTPAPYDPPKELVVKGLYRFTRNPMYVGVFLALVGEAALFESANLIIYALFVLLAFHLRVVYYEEPVLRRVFGKSFEEYCRSVPRWMLKVRAR
jgi:protein-S-isoprenylcysteine O-methyltransferase Ste14